MTEYYTAIIFITVFSMIIMIVATVTNSFMPAERKRSFILTFVFIMIVTLAEWLGVFLDGKAAGLRAFHLAAKCTEFSLTPVIPVICAGAIAPGKNHKGIYIPIAINAVLEIASAFFGFIYYVDRMNYYHRSEWYILYITAFTVSVLYLFYRSYKNSTTYQNRNIILLALILILMTVGISIQLVDRNVHVDWVSVALATMLFYIYYNQLILQIDAVTGLLNRASYERNIERLKAPAVFIMFDVDKFKNVNDTYGHAFGDACLEKIGALIKMSYGNRGLCYRYGGDEFCVILKKQQERVVKLNENFMHQLEEQRKSMPGLPWVSVGYAEFDPASESIDEAVKRSDTMMYYYKQNYIH